MKVVLSLFILFRAEEYAAVGAARLKVGVHFPARDRIVYIVVHIEGPGHIGYGRLQRSKSQREHRVGHRRCETETISHLVLYIVLHEICRQTVVAEISAHAHVGKLIQRAGAVAEMQRIVEQVSARTEAKGYGIEAHRLSSQLIQHHVAVDE